jgi:hypothetical protein
MSDGVGVPRRPPGTSAARPWQARADTDSRMAVTIGKGLLLLTPGELTTALKRGRWSQCRRAFEARRTPEAHR